MNIKMAKFVGEIIQTVRLACGVQGINQGAIGVCIAPALESENEWANLPDGATDVLFTAPVNPFSDTTLCFEPEGYVGDAAGVVAMKITAAKDLVAHYAKKGIVPPRELCTSGALLDELMGNGVVNWKGAVTIPICVFEGQAGYPVVSGCNIKTALAMNIYVAVSGGTEDQDENAAWSALKTIREIVDREAGYLLRVGF